ncbi:MAG TPA: DUF4012 domain-containing protein [Dehalococcoidia bacterium]|nr:DUF4012 domain-containing protein [Dehalococcoidia bacterium]
MDARQAPRNDTITGRLARWRAAVPLGRLLFVTVLVLGLIAGFEAYQAWRVVSDVNSGRVLLRTGQNRLEVKRLNATADDLAMSRSEFDAAGAKFSAARRQLERDPILGLVRHLPLVGGQVSAAIALAHIGEQGAAIGTQGVEAAQAFDAIRAEPGGTLPEKSVKVFDAADPHIANIELRLADVDARRKSIAGESLLPPMRRAVAELDQRRVRLQDFLDTYQRARAFSPEFLGFNGPRTYLVLAQNNGELLPTGGLVSVFGIVQLDHGRVLHMEFHDAVQYGADWMARGAPYVEPPLPLKEYLLKDTSWNLAVSNWSPDFPTSASWARYFYEQVGGGKVDGVIAIDVTTLERLLEVIGPVDIPEFGVTVDNNNAFDLTEQFTREAYAPNADRKSAFVGLLADEVLRRVLHPQPGQWSGLVDVLQQLGDHKDLLLYSTSPSQERLIAGLGWDGSVYYTSGDYLQLVDASVNSTKLNVVIDHSASVDVRLGPDGSAATNVTLDYFNDLTTWAKGRDPLLVQRLMLGGLYGGYVRLLAPPGSKLVSLKDGSQEVGAEEIGQEDGLAVFGRFFALPRDTRKQLTFAYDTPPVATQVGSDWVYTLALHRQPGWQLSSLTVRVTPPGAMRTRAALVDGKPVQPNADGSISIDLSQDRTLTVRYR